jgi:hypothetical protein
VEDATIVSEFIFMESQFVQYLLGNNVVKNHITTDVAILDRYCINELCFKYITVFYCILIEGEGA